MDTAKIKAHSLLSFLLSMLFLAMFQIVLIFNSERFKTEFLSQNYHLVDSGNAFALIPQLNSLSNQKSISCIKAISNNELFFKSRCERNLLGRNIFIRGNQDLITIELTYYLSSTLTLAIIGALLFALLASNFVLMLVFRIKDIRQEAQTKMNRLAQQVAHDIRSPLSALNMFIGYDKNIPLEQKEIIQQVVLRINGIADDLLNESKNTSRPSAVTSTTTKVEQNHKILPALKTLTAEKNLEFKGIPGVDVVPRFNNTPEEVEVAIPDKSIQRILSNLINNSVEAITDNGMIFIEVQVRAQTLIISVIDFGKGIPPNVLDKLNRKEFLSYGKEHSSKSGSGIGLESAYNDLQKVGGSLKIESKLEVGTRVTIELPITNSVT